MAGQGKAWPGVARYGQARRGMDSISKGRCSQPPPGMRAGGGPAVQPLGTRGRAANLFRNS